jgi:hypothetical protein
MKTKTISVTVSRTVQIQQFHPSVVSMTETAEIESGDDVRKCKIQLYKACSETVETCMNREIKKYQDEE